MKGFRSRKVWHLQHKRLQWTQADFVINKVGLDPPSALRTNKEAPALQMSCLRHNMVAQALHTHHSFNLLVETLVHYLLNAGDPFIITSYFRQQVSVFPKPMVRWVASDTTNWVAADVSQRRHLIIGLTKLLYRLMCKDSDQVLSVF